MGHRLRYLAKRAGKTTSGDHVALDLAEHKLNLANSMSG